MRIDKQKCLGCGACAQICTLSKQQIIVARRDEKDGRIYYEVDEDECVECGVCLRESGCPSDALFQPEMDYPRIIRSQFSDPKVLHPNTNGGGRGTEEMKTNELTGKIQPGDVGIMVEMGRPNVGCWFTDVQKVTTGLAELEIKFEERNPTSYLFEDIEKGVFREEVLGQKVMSAIVELRCTEEYAPTVLKRIRQLAEEVNTCFSVGMISCFGNDYYFPGAEICNRAGWEAYPNGKLNIGVGRIVEEALGKEY